ncbi:MAG: dihydrolipoamide acetyltransferase family protein [Planctomycetota bacterium]|nr:dihydrolipoamide acetyltransferase family protein [Planctomycetota bacterium]
MAHHKSSDPNVFILPDLGEGVHEAELLKWRVQVGQYVNELDVLADMETDKAVVEVPSPRAGTIAQLHGTEGEILKVGNAFVSYRADASVAAAPAATRTSFQSTGAATADARANGSAASVAASVDAAHAMANADLANTDLDIAEPGERTEDAGTVVGSMSGAAAGVAASPGKALATPAVRRLARDLGVNIDQISGSGIGGRVLDKDVRAAAGRGSSSARAATASPAHSTTHTTSHPKSPTATPAQARSSSSGYRGAPGRAASTQAAACDMGEPSIPPAPVRVSPPAGVDLAAARAGAGRDQAPSRDETTRIPFRGVRRTIANRLRESMNQAVHFTVMDEADVSPLDHVRKQLAGASGEKVSFLPFVCSAVARVLGNQKFSALNATVDEQPGSSENAFIVQHRSVHLGIATDTDNGLMVPVIRDADRLGVLQISRSIEQIARAARDRTIARDGLSGSTFTISNVGSHAGRFATPVINYPEVGILAVGRAREGMVVHKGSFRVGLLLPLSLACDHRVVDGATAALALAEIVKLLQEPQGLLGPARG